MKFIEGRYEPEKFYEMAKGLENEPERGARCVKCYRMRIEESAVIAKQNNFDYFTTTLSISPQKDSHVLNSIGKAVCILGFIFVYWGRYIVYDLTSPLLWVVFAVLAEYCICGIYALKCQREEKNLNKSITAQ